MSSVFSDLNLDDLGVFDPAVVPQDQVQDGLGLLDDLKTEDLVGQDPSASPDLALGASALDLPTMGMEDVVTEALCNEEPFSFLDWDLDSAASTTSNSGASGSGSGASEEVEPVKADLMWSQPCLVEPSRQQTSQSSAARWRQQSLSLSECADSLFSDMDLDGSDEAIRKILDSGPADIKDEQDDEDEEEEIDVVSDAASSASTASCTSSVAHRHWQRHFRNKHQQQQQQQQQQQRPHIQAGRSVLRKNHQRGKVAPPSPSTYNMQPMNPIDHSLVDHCYYATTAPSSPASASVASASQPASPYMPLTPTESSDDDDSMATFVGQSRKRRNNGSVLNPAKRARRTEDLATQEEKEKVKFKFRMAFKQQQMLLQQQQQQQQPSSSRSVLQSNAGGSKRKSALKNAHCPSPTKQQHFEEEHQHQQALIQERLHPQQPQQQQQHASRPSPKTTPSSSGRRSKYAGITSDEKCREIRDLHNSMERQRRVDLKKHFDILKDMVPELVDMDKASKLTILNKASEHCRNLAANAAKMEAEEERERARNLALNKKLSQLKAAFARGGNANAGAHQGHRNGRRMSSGRVSVLSSRLC